MFKQYQQDRVNLIKSILPYFGDQYVLKGGTALYLNYGLNRYSEDIDLDCLGQNMNFIRNIKRHPDASKWNIAVRKETPTVFRIMLDYGALSEKGAYPLKIEVSSRNSKLLTAGELKYEQHSGYNVYSIEELIAMKIRAFNGRDKIRDFYDICFLSPPLVDLTS